MSLLKETQKDSSIKNIDNNILAITESYLKEFVAPVASEIDQSSEALNEALQGLIKRSLLSIKVPKAWGGLEADTETFYHFQQLISQYSGALAFLQVQHQGAVASIVYSKNEALKEQYLSKIVEGKLLCGLGFSQLRRKGKPMITATPMNGGYEINGTVPWITGFGFFDAFLLGASLPDGQTIRAMVPFQNSHQDAGGEFLVSEPMKLGAMQSTNTVTGTFKNWFLPSENVVSMAKEGAIHENDKKIVLFPSFLVLGCAKAGLDIVKKVAQTKQLDFINEGFNHLNEELNYCQEKIQTAITINSRSFEDDLKLRVWAINLAQRCANAAVIVSSGAANYYNHAAQRVYKEALVFTVFGQTTDIMKATLEQMVYN